MGVGKRKRRQEGKGLATTVTDAAPNLNPVVILIVSLLTTPAVADDGVPIANRTSAQHSGGPAGPGSFRVALPIGKWDKENRSDGDSAARVATCPDLKPKAESSPPDIKSQLEKNIASAGDYTCEKGIDHGQNPSPVSTQDYVAGYPADSLATDPGLGGHNDGEVT